MAIDLNHETVIPLREVPSLLPARRAGKKVHLSCCYRWTKNGCRGVVLESIQVGATRCTSIEAVQRFCDQLTEAANSQTKSMHAVARRRRDVEAATRELEREGV